MVLDGRRERAYRESGIVTDAAPLSGAYAHAAFVHMEDSMSTADNSEANTTTTASGVTEARLGRLRIWNVALTVLHAAQAVAIFVLATDFAISISATFPAGPPGTPPEPPEALFDVRIGIAIATFLTLAALDHLLTSTVFRKRYEADLRAGINRFRWLEYAFSATLMVLLIGFYSGITGISAAIGIVGANVAMILFGWLQEKMNPPGRHRTTMLPFWFGTLVGLAPWAAIALNLVGAEFVPDFVYGIFVSLFVFYMSFGVNQWLQYREVGPWRSYAFGETAYLVLSLAAKSALAWQIFAGSLAG